MSQAKFTLAGPYAETPRTRIPPSSSTAQVGRATAHPRVAPSLGTPISGGRRIQHVRMRTRLHFDPGVTAAPLRRSPRGSATRRMRASKRDRPEQPQPCAAPNAPSASASGGSREVRLGKCTTALARGSQSWRCVQALRLANILYATTGGYLDALACATKWRPPQPHHLFALYNPPRERPGRMNGSLETVAATFLQLVDATADDFDVIAVLTTLSRRCVELFDVSASGVLLADSHGALQVIAASSEQATLLDLFQIDNEEGPGPRRVPIGSRGVPRLPPCRGRGQPWPHFSRAAIESGLSSVHAFPIGVHDTVVGSLNLFMTTPGPLWDDRRHARPGVRARRRHRAVAKPDGQRTSSDDRATAARVEQSSDHRTSQGHHRRARRRRHGRGVRAAAFLCPLPQDETDECRPGRRGSHAHRHRDRDPAAAPAHDRKQCPGRAPCPPTTPRCRSATKTTPSRRATRIATPGRVVGTKVRAAPHRRTSQQNALVVALGAEEFAASSISGESSVNRSVSAFSGKGADVRYEPL